MMAWMEVPCGTRMRGPGTWGALPDSEKAKTLKLGPVSASGNQSAVRSSRWIARVVPDSAPAGAWFELGWMRDDSSPAAKVEIKDRRNASNSGDRYRRGGNMTQY